VIEREQPFVKVLTKENASELLGGKPLEAFVSQLSNRVSLVGGTYSIPPDSGKQAKPHFRESCA
jgi:hypothetical protein